MTATGLIPENERLTGFVAVAIRFPDDPTAHRIERLYHRPDGTDMGAPTKFDGSTPFRDEIRPACSPDSDPGGRLYELSVPTALARGAVACPRTECFGGEPC
ncbi:hypothetical protein [Paractinoplanes rishiriensis]|uniref:Uncharacterized protein n=1 Tax=Paractinoplanes rishiriensis TaxID=1050105 RepID=A0A919KBB1_9ACTN|nr:hypothetical protein [Actinoplanes rishiriensis]GIF02341.1 hypothetical protein Ari01nite_98050 [Actinoplanes rishiriensis]